MDFSVRFIFAAARPRAASLASTGQFTFCTWQKYFDPPPWGASPVTVPLVKALCWRKPLAALPPDGCGVPPAGKEMSIPSLSCKKRPRPYGQGRKSYAVPPWFRQPLPDGAQRPGGPRPVTGPAVPPYYVRSGGRLREQSSAKVPHRLAAAAGSLKAGHFAFLPINVVNGSILCGFARFVKR